MAELMGETFASMGLQVQWQQVEEGRANVLGTWAGAGDGPSLMFNGHMDTSYSGREPWLAACGVPAERVRQGRAAVRARDLEHEGRARLLRRGGAGAAGRGRPARRRRDDRRGLRRDREGAVGRGAGRASTAAMRPGRATSSRTAASPTCASSASRRSRRSCSAISARSGCGSRPPATSSTRPSARASAGRTRSCACARCSMRCSNGSRPGRATRRTPTGAFRRSSA